MAESIYNLISKLAEVFPTQPIGSFEEWVSKNKINEPTSPLHFYDLLGAWKAGINRNVFPPLRTEYGHFPDTFKLPGHSTFSEESIYAKPPFKFGIWEGDQYVPYAEWMKR